MIQQSEKVKAFLADIEAVCRKHDLVLAHEDSGGAFEVYDIKESDIGWVMEAHDMTSGG